MPGPIFLENETVTLRPAAEEDVPFLRENEQNPRVRASRSAHKPVSTEWARERLGGTMGRDGETLGLLVCVDEQPVGFSYLLREQPTAQVFRFGELAYWITPEQWGNGYATAAGELLLAHAFDELGLHRLEATSCATNDGSRRVIEKLGFTQEGTARDKALVDGEWTDMIHYGLLEQDWSDQE